MVSPGDYRIPVHLAAVWLYFLSRGISPARWEDTLSFDFQEGKGPLARARLGSVAVLLAGHIKLRDW